MEQKKTMLSEIIQTQRDKSCVYLPFVVAKENWPEYRLS